MKEQPADGDRFKVLIVDDERPVLDLMADIVEGAGCEAHPENSPLNALRLIKRQRFDALILDVYMPELHGMLFHAKVRVLDRELADRTVFVSGMFTREELRHDLEATARLLPKPFSPPQLVGLLHQVLPDRPRSRSGPQNSDSLTRKG